MQVLKLADDLFVPLRADGKFCTIRKGRRNVELGELQFEGAQDASLKEVVIVTSVTFTSLGGVPEETLEADGFRDHEDALEQMKSFYPDITFDTEVTVVNFFVNDIRITSTSGDTEAFGGSDIGGRARM